MMVMPLNFINLQFPQEDVPLLPLIALLIEAMLVGDEVNIS